MPKPKILLGVAEGKSLLKAMWDLTSNNCKLFQIANVKFEFVTWVPVV